MAATVIRVAAVDGQSPANPDSASDFVTICDAYGESEIVFVGRAEAPVTVRISGEAEVETARQNLIRTEADVAWLRATLDLMTKFERNSELESKIADAKSELNRRQAMYPPPHDVTLIPVRVEQAFRGVTEPTLMLRQHDPSVRIEPGSLYLISGLRSRDLMPPFNEMGNGVDLEYVDVERVTNVASARQELQVLASTVSGATVTGTLRMRLLGDGLVRTPSYPDSGAPLSGVRVVVSSGSHVVETLTRDDGSFTVSGIQAGRLEITPVLRENPTIVNRSALTVHVRGGGCRAVGLTAALNGRVRGRILSATGQGLDGVELVLQGLDSSGRMGGADLPRSSLRPNEDGTFEFFGQSPGSYVVSAQRAMAEDGNGRYLTTYFPGTPDLAAAVPIVIGEATEHDGVDFLVKTE